MLGRRRFFQGPVGSGHRRKDVVWFRPDGEVMTDGDWQDTGRHALGMLLDGQLIPDRLPRGERVIGDTLLALLNSHHFDLGWRLPGDWADGWEVVFDSALEGDEQPDSRRHQSGQVLSLQSRSLIVLRALQAQPLS